MKNRSRNSLRKKKLNIQSPISLKQAVLLFLWTVSFILFLYVHACVSLYTRICGGLCVVYACVFVCVCVYTDTRSCDIVPESPGFIFLVGRLTILPWFYPRLST